MEALEQTVKGIPPKWVGNVAPVAALQLVRLEQTPVQEWNSTEAASSGASGGARLVESPEEQRAKEIALNPSPVAQAKIDFFCQELCSSAQPARALNDLEEQDAGELNQHQPVPVRGRHGSGQ